MQPGLALAWAREGVEVSLELAPPDQLQAPAQACTYMKTQVTLPSLLPLPYLKNTTAPQTSPRTDPARQDLGALMGHDGEALPLPLSSLGSHRSPRSSRLASPKPPMRPSEDDSNGHPSLWGVSSRFYSQNRGARPSWPLPLLCRGVPG